MDDRRIRLEWVVETALLRSARHELGDALRALGLTACGLKRLSFQISRTNGIGGSPLASACCCMIGQTISTNSLGPASARPAAVAPASTRASTPPAFAGNASRKSPIAKATVRMAHIIGQCRISLRLESIPPDVGS